MELAFFCVRHGPRLRVQSKEWEHFPDAPGSTSFSFEATAARIEHRPGVAQATAAAFFGAHRPAPQLQLKVLSSGDIWPRPPLTQRLSDKRLSTDVVCPLHGTLAPNLSWRHVLRSVVL